MSQPAELLWLAVQIKHMLSQLSDLVFCTWVYDVSGAREEKGVQVLSESVKSLWKLRMQVYVAVLIFFV